MVRSETASPYPEVPIAALSLFLEAAQVWNAINTEAGARLQSLPLRNQAFPTEKEVRYHIGSHLVLAWLSLQDQGSLGHALFQKIPETCK